uniref:Uncharacterized protein n=1 Tax=Anguilla anguilla TaxID=7936 RepID=A0A0E9TKA6_ANGAN
MVWGIGWGMRVCGARCAVCGGGVFCHGVGYRVTG